MRVVVDWDLCQGLGQCEFAAPDVFTINDDGELEVLDPTPPESLRADLDEAVRRCPTRALSLEERAADGTAVGGTHGESFR